jgi:ribonucleotide monophosphatase NagD (HAD superfamily)
MCACTGDRLDTDIAFGYAAGMRTALPLTGVTTSEVRNTHIFLRHLY